jgi:hypothetical protein
MLQSVSFVLDVILVVAALAAYFARPRIGGELVKGLHRLLTGILILGLAHLFETLLFVLFNVGTEANEVVHRVLVGVAFVFVIAGFNQMRKAFES